MRSQVGDIEASKKCIDSTCAKFYKDLYSRRNDERKDEKDNDGRLKNNCDHADDDENIKDDAHDKYIPQLTMK